MSVMFLKVRASCEASGQPLTSRTRIVYARRLRFDVGMSPRSIPPKLYKYRRFDVFCLRLLTQAEVSYSDPRTFNDPLDCDPTIEVDINRKDLERLCFTFLRRTQPEDQAKNEINNYRYLSTEYGDFRTEPDVEGYLKRMVADRIKAELAQELGSRGVLSLSECWDSVLMWSHYADNHRGICIEFDTTELPHPNLKAVDYRAPRRVRASDLFEWKLRHSVDAERRVRDTYFFAKAGPWRYEREWREVEEKSGIREAGFRVTGIHFGLQCDAAVIQSVVKLLADDSDVALYSIYPLDDSFRIKRRPVDRDEIGSYGLRAPATIEFKDVFVDDDIVSPNEAAGPSR